MKLNRYQMAAVKRTALNTKKLLQTKKKLEAQILDLNDRINNLIKDIDVWEKPIKEMTKGFTSEEVIAMNGEIPDEGKIINQITLDTNNWNEVRGIEDILWAKNQFVNLEQIMKNEVPIYAPFEIENNNNLNPLNN